ncbi:hypothetical protein PYR74_13085 [Acinetobacter bereziniae]|jgi:hypothetical protein|uniref:Uncharacterized protein n=1 Tax=Acinetobacter bereziniae LMG 1003 = CIP 70.12 TaxID=981324 RepID=N9DFR1_ACIBZ|nr:MULTISPECIES: hypothetical protein [Acinetobacter]ATZ63904.1 hypothetical protein BSR55_11305 [Acinetobacter bereziniae]ELW86080.1 hypothetical protein ACINWC743_A0430 [Acinetobacter sp. WC-743]ENV96636.1 hypothetical protein F938_02197 [Acinetobacter bereziniae LMG 1003 = CIP 70.12]MBJ8424683.1 hypothetical protein [Acinetobacter bereziniae]MBJ8452305.1 hypothetical protein [Acinetobacter bereziniae]
MKMKFFIVAKLLSATGGLLLSGYVAFALSIFAILFKGWQTIELWIFIVITLLLMAVHHYLSFRVKFDAELIEMLAIQSRADSIEHLTQQFDQSLLEMKLLPQNKVGRDWTLRFAGCFRLIKLQIALVLIQYLVLIILIYRII